MPSDSPFQIQLSLSLSLSFLFLPLVHVESDPWDEMEMPLPIDSVTGETCSRQEKYLSWRRERKKDAHMTKEDELHDQGKK